MTDRVWILGVPLDPVGLGEALDRACALIRAGGNHLVVTANPELVVAARSDPELARAVRAASLVVADGIGLVWASRYLRQPVPERVPGIELMELLCDRAAEEGWPVFLLGGLSGVAEEAAVNLRRRWPHLQVAGTHHGYFQVDDPVVHKVARSGARVLFCGLGSPRQELWLHRNLPRLDVRLAMGVGGSLDVLAGRTRRAPRWVRQAHLEWLYRLATQPWRWRRQLALPSFAWMVLRSRPGREGRG